ncbi:undecaprenyl/decaprenyl-phosphate alpha-N-acetylglucosaminyl 1-phosphate transferase [Fulvivirga sp. M361]|uniref:glycosyltransferase family 4 protein n=1 Tax=Fulvivirga sp. M361 TaxID=2594266 RepID=UPI00117B841F|nr:MraY family glycosyltransferase [Fulvivirga sp. M361]TRX51645.1 undecaprenyl/decaprenyl-phosphate alpha-N-acetylglucosaminyl 1-phosphate transferase [Fulvivirga sp. M361]
MTAIFLAIATSFIITFLVIPVIINFSKKKKKMMDVPGRRKIHKKTTPSLGGIGIFMGLIVSLIVWLPFEAFQQFKFILAGLLILVVIGFRDDIVPLKPLYKLFGQMIAAAMIVYLTGIRLTSFYGLFGIDELNPLVSQFVSIFTIIVITNSFNLIDGLDGLAGTIAVVALTTFGVWFYLVGDQWTSLLALSMAGAVIAFLTFNWEPSNIFMGDTGALSIGFLFAVLAIKFIEVNHNLPEAADFKFNASVTTGICIIIIPLFDTLRIFILRLSKKQSPFTPDKNHMHHALMRMGMSHSQTALSLGLLNLFYIGIALAGRGFPDSVLLPAVLIFSVLLSLTLDFLIVRKLNRSK